jgi:hypothetical protein
MPPETVSAVDGEEVIPIKPFKGSTEIESVEGYSYFFEWNVEPKITYEPPTADSSWDRIDFNMTSPENFVKFTNTSGMTAPNIEFFIQPISKAPNEELEKAAWYRYFINSDPGSYYYDTFDLIDGMPYGDWEYMLPFGTFGSQHDLADGETVTVSGASERDQDLAPVGGHANGKDIDLIEGIAGWVFRIGFVSPGADGYWFDSDGICEGCEFYGDNATSLVPDDFAPSDSTMDYGFLEMADHKDPGFDWSVTTKDLLLVDPLNWNQFASSEPDAGEERSLSYRSDLVAEPVDLTISGDVYGLLAGDGWESLKAYGSILAAYDSDQMDSWLDELGFVDVVREELSGDISWQVEDVGVWFARLEAGRQDLVLTFVEGSPDVLEDPGRWLEDGAYEAGERGRHEVFDQARVEVAELLGAYLDGVGVDAGDVLHAIGGYSAGAAVADLLADGSEVGGVELTDANTNTVGFGTLNSVQDREGDPAEQVTDVVSQSFVENLGGPGWGKTGQVVGYPFSQDLLDGFFGDNTLGEVGDWGVAHRVENYVANVFTDEPDEDFLGSGLLEWWDTAVDGPVDVAVVRDDELVARLVGDEAESRDPNVVVVRGEDGRTQAVVPDGGGYRLFVRAVGEGEAGVWSGLLGFGTEDGSGPRSYSLTKDAVYEVEYDSGGAVSLANSASRYFDQWDNPVLLFLKRHVYTVVAVSAVLVIGTVLLFTVARPGRRHTAQTS